MFFFGALGENTAPQEPLQDPDGLEVVSSPQVSRGTTGNYSNASAVCYWPLVSQPHPGSPRDLGMLSSTVCKSFLVSFHLKPRELERRLCSCVCLVPPVPQPVSLGDRAVEMADRWLSVLLHPLLPC